MITGNTRQVVDRGGGYTTCSYVVSKPGDYSIHIKWDGEHVPDSPTDVFIAPNNEDAKKANVRDMKDRGVEVNQMYFSLIRHCLRTVGGKTASVVH